MLALPPVLQELIHRLARLPGVGPKAAARIALGLLRWERSEVDQLAAALVEGRGRASHCPRCGCLSQDGFECGVCADPARSGAVLCVVEGPLDALALERGAVFTGRYHVLGGALSPLRGILPEDLAVAALLARIAAEATSEVIVATNASPEGEATAMYVKQVLDELNATRPAEQAVAVSRLARGLPSGAQLDYADAATLQSALEHRTRL